MGLEEKESEGVYVCMAWLSSPRRIRLRHDMLICEHQGNGKFP